LRSAIAVEILFLALSLWSIPASGGDHKTLSLTGQDAVEYGCGSVTYTPPQLAWTDIPGAKTYVIERSDGRGYREIARVDGLSYSDQNALETGYQWYYRVSAAKGNGNSTVKYSSNEIELRMLAVDCPPEFKP
jgi:hypothetical protein